MIHRIIVGPETDLSELKKLFRKKLMTGGAVVRLKDGLRESDLRELLEKFSVGLEEHSIQAAVLSEVVKHELLTAELAARLRAIGYREIDRAFEQRSFAIEPVKSCDAVC